VATIIAFVGLASTARAQTAPPASSGDEQQRTAIPAPAKTSGDAAAARASDATSTSTAQAPQAATSSGQASFPWGTAGLVGAGAGVVALVVGLYFGLVVAPTKQEDANSTGCGPSANNCTPLGAAARRDYNLAATASTVLFVAGGVLAATGVTVWLLAPSSASRGAAVSATPLVAPGVAGIALNANWR